MNLQLSEKKTLVTGSTAGIGFAIARALAREGASVVVTGRTQERVDDAIANVRKEIRDAKISGIAANLATPNGISKCIEAVPTVDVLVNNLGVYEVKPFEQDRKSTRLNSSHPSISYAVFCLKKKRRTAGR